MKGKALKKGLLLLAGLVLTLGMVKIPAQAADVIVNENTFPDPVFRAYVLSEFDNDHDNQLSQSEINEATYVYLDGDYNAPGDVQTLQGIEYLTELENLNCSYNKITSLDLSHNTKLCGLYCDSNPLTGLNVSYLQNLVWLNCSACGLNSLDVSAFTQLTTLYCSSNNLTSLDLHNNQNLETLGCSSNNIGSLDLSSNTLLQSIQVQDNPIHVLNIENNPNLVNIMENGEGPLENHFGCCYAIDYSFVWTNEGVLIVTNVPAGQHLIDAWADLSYGGKVTGYGMYTRGSTVTLKVMTKAGYHFVGWEENGQILSTQTEYSFTAITSRRIRAVIEMDEVLVNGLPITAQYFPDESFRALVKAQFDGDHNDKLSIDELNAVTVIDCAGDYEAAGNITSLAGIEYFANLNTLYCEWNQLTSLDVSQNEELYSLSCQYNQIQVLDLSDLHSLYSVNCSDNQLTTLNVDGDSHLVYLYCYFNNIESLDVSDCAALEVLQCFNNQIATLDITNNPLLRNVIISDNPLDRLDVSQCPIIDNLVINTEPEYEYSTISYTLDWDQLYIDDNDVIVTSQGTVRPPLKGSVTITGEYRYGEKLTCVVTDTNNTGNLLYQWTRDGVPIQRATSRTYTCKKADVGKHIGCTVSSNKQGGSITYVNEYATVAKAYGPDAPTGITAQFASSETANDGKLIGTTTAMEYADNFNFLNPVACTDGETTGLAKGAYYVRYKETDTHYAGSNVFVYVGVGEISYEPVTMVSAQVSFDGKVGLVYGVTIPQWLQEDSNAYAAITVDGTEHQKKISNIVAAGMTEEGTYRVVQYVPAVYYRDNMNLRFYTGEGQRVTIIGHYNGRDLTETGVDYSIERYVNSIKNSSPMNSNTYKLVTALEDYCTAAQILFDHNSTGLSVSSTVSDLSPSVLSTYASTGSENFITGITGKKLTVSFEADNSIKVGFVFASGVNPSSYKYYVDKKPAKLKYSEHFGYYIMAKNIPAAYLHLPHEFKVKKGTETYIVNCSALTYAKAIVGSADTKVSNLAKALYLYNQAAKTYFNVE